MEYLDTKTVNADHLSSSFQLALLGFSMFLLFLFCVFIYECV